jgi:hypothetical protein
MLLAGAEALAEPSATYATEVATTRTRTTTTKTATTTTTTTTTTTKKTQSVLKLKSLNRLTCAEKSTMPSSSRDFGRRRKSWARRVERCCCGVLGYLPLAFVYGLLTWAAWVQISIGFWPNQGKWTGKTTSLIGVVLYSLAVSSYSVAVFKDPGSPANTSAPGGYASLPTHDTDPLPAYTSLTAKSSGKPRYCKKCNSIKPDRTHHCSSCNRCVLKMDHHW